jgi:hypothetical protein
MRDAEERSTEDTKSTFQKYGRMVADAYFERSFCKPFPKWGRIIQWPPRMRREGWSFVRRESNGSPMARNSCVVLLPRGLFFLEAIRCWGR